MERHNAQMADTGLHIHFGEGITVLELITKYIRQKRGVKHTIQAGYQTIPKIPEKDSFYKRCLKTCFLNGSE